MARVTIRKVPLEFIPKQTFKIHADAIILPGVYHRGPEHVLYVMGKSHPLTLKVKIRRFTTASDFNYDPATMNYLGSIHHDDDCHHFFRVNDE